MITLYQRLTLTIEKKNTIIKLILRVTHQELDESWNSVDGKYELQLGQRYFLYYFFVILTDLVEP